MRRGEFAYVHTLFSGSGVEIDWDPFVVVDGEGLDCDILVPLQYFIANFGVCWTPDREVNVFDFNVYFIRIIWQKTINGCTLIGMVEDTDYEYYFGSIIINFAKREREGLKSLTQIILIRSISYSWKRSFVKSAFLTLTYKIQIDGYIKIGCFLSK